MGLPDQSAKDRTEWDAFIEEAKAMGDVYRALEIYNTPGISHAPQLGTASQCRKDSKQ